MHEQPAFDQALAGVLKIKVVLRENTVMDQTHDLLFLRVEITVQSLHLRLQFEQRFSVAHDVVPEPVGFQEIFAELKFIEIRDGGGLRFGD